MKEVWSDKKRTVFGLPLSFTKYILDEERLFIRSGVFTKVEDEIWLHRIMDITLRQTLRQRIDGVGTIHCCSSDASQREFSIKNIKHPREVRELLSTMIEAQKDKKRVIFHETLMSTPEDDDDSVASQVHRSR